jgi:hypothetical protein
MTQGGAAAASAASALPWAVMWLPLRGVVDASLSQTLSLAVLDLLASAFFRLQSYCLLSSLVCVRMVVAAQRRDS